MFMDRLKCEILPKVFSKEGGEIVRCDCDSKERGKDQFASNVVFVKVTLKIKNGITDIPLVVKVEPFKQQVRELVNSDMQFHNEVFMYTKVLPVLENSNEKSVIFPTFYHGVGLLNNSNDNIVILEDLRPLGFTLSESKISLDFAHLALAMSKLGQFHALSYIAKANSPEEFSKLTSGFKDNFCIKEHRAHEMMKACLHRAIDPLLKKHEDVDGLHRFLAKVDKDFLQVILDITSPEEPMAVICHGDFCRNNILYKYSNGQPVDVRFFDIATSRYASPAIDISFILFLNSSRDLRQARLESLLEIYHQALSNAAGAAQIPTLADINDDMRRKGLWGLIHCSYFLPVMMFPTFFKIENITSPEELIRFNVSRGGDEGTKVLNEMVEEMLQRKMFDLW